MGMRRFRNATKRNPSFGFVGSLVLLCLFIAAETVATVHSLDYDAHAGSDPCKICISISSLDHAAAASAPVLMQPAAAAADVFPEVDSPPFARAEAPNARGPPQAS